MGLRMIVYACALGDLPNADAIATQLVTPVTGTSGPLKSADVPVLPLMDPSVAAGGNGYFAPAGSHVLGAYAAA